MSTELMIATNSTGSISMTGMHRAGERRYQITVVGKVGLEVAYGSAAVTDGATTTEIEVEMSLSF